MADLKLYELNGKTFQYLAGDQPEGAKEVKPQADKQAPKPAANKQAKPAANK